MTLEARLRRRLSPWELVLVAGVLVGVIVSLVISNATRGKVERIETRVEKVETRVVRILVPCLQTNDRVCRMFLNRLLAAATPEQLDRLRGARLSPSAVRREIRRFEQDRRQAAERRERRANREGVRPGSNKPPSGQRRAAQPNGAWGRPLDPPQLIIEGRP